jgi:O-succinylbenzoate synthase
MTNDELLIQAAEKALDAWGEVTLPPMNGDADELAQAMDNLSAAVAAWYQPKIDEQAAKHYRDAIMGTNRALTETLVAGLRKSMP